MFFFSWFRCFNGVLKVMRVGNVRLKGGYGYGFEKGEMNWGEKRIQKRVNKGTRHQIDRSFP